MKRKRLLLEGVVVLAILGSLWLVLYPAIQAARDASLFPDGPYGELIPSDPPHESRRIAHASGFSIVVPPNWELFDRNPIVQIAARHRGGGMRLKSFITIWPTNSPDAILSDLTRTTFNGHIAYEKKMHVEREDTFDDPAFSSYSLFVEASGKWWLIEYGLADEIDSLPPEIAGYIATIRFNENVSEPSDATELPIGSEIDG